MCGIKECSLIEALLWPCALSLCYEKQLQDGSYVRMPANSLQDVISQQNDLLYKMKIWYYSPTIWPLVLVLATDISCYLPQVYFILNCFIRNEAIWQASPHCLIPPHQLMSRSLNIPSLRTVLVHITARKECSFSDCKIPWDHVAVAVVIHVSKGIVTIAAINAFFWMPTNIDWWHTASGFPFPHKAILIIPVHGDG